MSSLRSKDIEIPSGKPFENCKLEREQYAKVLTQIIESYKDGFVLSVNNKWGEGKTTFIKMWTIYLGLPEHRFKTIYFNAWEHDFGQDPMAAILSEIKSLDLGDKDKLEGIIKKAAKFSIHAIPILLKAAAEKYINTETFTDGIQGLSEKAIDAFQSEVDEYAKKKESLIKFKEALGEYVSKLEKPLVFIIDELDRCNPKYAVEVLEIVKHFFSVPGIVFVLSIDKEQLGNAIRGYYGSNLINADEYLRRFIDLEYSLPAPNIEKYILSLFERLRFKEFFGSNRNDELNRFIYFSSWIVSVRKMSPMQIEKIFIHCRISLKSISSNHLFFPDVFFFLIYLKFYDIEFYNSIKEKKFIVHDAPNKLLKWFDDNAIDRRKLDIGVFELLFVFLYNKARNDFDKLYQYSGQKYNLNFLPKNSNFSDQQYIDIIINFEQTFNKQYDIDYILRKIDLFENLEF
jgi:hypothetical protein